MIAFSFVARRSSSEATRSVASLFRSGSLILPMAISVLGSKLSGIERSPRRRIRHRPAGRERQAPTPELPGPLADPSRLGLKHGLGQPIRTKCLFEAPHIVERGQ